MRIAKRTSLAHLLAILGGFLIALNSVSALAAETSPPDLVAEVAAAKDKFVPITAEHVAAAKKSLIGAMKTLSPLLDTSGKANGDQWRTFLEWPTLTAITTSDAAPKADDVSLVLSKFKSNKPGIERPTMSAVRDALVHYAALSAAAADPKLAETYAAKMTRLGEILATYKTAPTTDLALEIGQILGWLEACGQDAKLVALIQTSLSETNLVASVSKRFAAAGIEEPVDRVTPVRDVILGTNIVGTARLQGKTSLEFIPSDSSAKMAIHLDGTATSNNVGYNGPVTIWSTGVTNVKATTTLTMTDAGLCNELASACCTTSTTFTGLCAKCNLVEKIGWKQAYKKKSQGEAIASAHAEDRIEAQMNDQASKTVAENNDKFINRFRKPLTRRGGFPQKLQFSTLKDRAVAKIQQVGKGQVGAPTAAPAPGADYDVAVAAHESVVTNFGEAVLGGVTLTDEMLVEIITDELKSEVPEELQITEDKDPWSITFAEATPVRATFSTEALKLAIRGTRFTRGDQKFSEPIEISAIYKVEKTEKGTKLTRQGDVEVTFLGRDRLGPTQVAFKTFLRRKFEAMFKQDFTSEGIALKGRWEKAGKLALEELKMEGGWLSLGWNLPAAAETTPAAETKPVAAQLPAVDEVSTTATTTSEAVAAN